MRTHFVLLILAVALMASCRGEEPKRMPDTLPDVQGRITTLQASTDENDKVITTIGVESIEGIESDYPRASIIAGENTLIETDDGQELRVNELQEGQNVQVWIEGDVIESSSIQAKASAIRITND